MGPFETKRLHLRRFRLADLDDIYTQVYADPAVCAMYCGETLSRAQVHNRLLYRAHQPDSAEFGYLAIVLRATTGASARVIGQINLTPFANSYYRLPGEPATPCNALEVELAFALGAAYWGQGLAFEACQPVIRYAFEALKVPRLMSGIVMTNERSIDLHKRLGYRIERNQCEDDICGLVAVLDNPLIRNA
ncbi:MAG TPA: GNAT family N-acetyltransferase [Anaerolineae bacterium]|nr:GNAT family N-acetyltransferase [Anaerolineae bacterium]HQI83067.1 GNAT family N-acetyltransferase [Anaerolineae bacterium]